MVSLLPPPSLFEDTVQRPRRQIVAWLARDGDSTRLCRVLKLSMTSLCGNQVPAIISQSIKDLTNFHKTSIPQQALESKDAGEDTKS